MLVRASSTARVIDLRCTAGNPRVSASGSIAPRTTESNLGLLFSASISKKPRCRPDVRFRPSFVAGRGEVFMCKMSGLLGEVVGGFEIPAEEPDLAVYVALEERRSVWACELAMNRDGGRARDGCHLPGPLTARLETSNRAVENHEVGSTRGAAVAVAIDVLKSSLFLKLAK